MAALHCITKPRLEHQEGVYESQDKNHKKVHSKEDKTMQ